MSTRAPLARFLRPREFDQVFAHDQAGKEVVDFLVERAELGRRREKSSMAFDQAAKFARKTQFVEPDRDLVRGEDAMG